MTREYTDDSAHDDDDRCEHYKLVRDIIVIMSMSLIHPEKSLLTNSLISRDILVVVIFLLLPSSYPIHHRHPATAIEIFSSLSLSPFSSPPRMGDHRRSGRPT